MTTTLSQMTVGNPSDNISESGDVRYYASEDFTAIDGTHYQAGALDSRDFFLPGTWTRSNGSITIPQIANFPTTTDAVPNSAKIACALYDRNRRIATVFEDYFIPSDPDGPLTLLALTGYNGIPYPVRSTDTLSRQDFLLMLQQYAQGMLKETPAGVINGVNNTFTLSHVPVLGSQMGYLNGNLQPEGNLGAGTESYTISGAVVTHNLPPQIGDRFVFAYRTTGGLVAGGTIPTQIQEGGGPTVLSLGNIPDNLFFRRSGSTVIGDDPLLDTGNIVIGADTGAIGTSTVALQTRGLTRLQITNAGNVSVVNNLGINFSVPTAKLHIKPSYADGINAAEDVIKVSNPNGTTFAFQVQQSMQGGNPNDDVMWWGWNLDQADPYGVASIHFAMERQFGTVWEVHLECHIPSGANPRPWTWSIDRTTGAATVVTTGDSYWSVGVQGHAPDTTNQIDFTAADILFTGRTGPVHIKADIALFETLNNGGATGKQFSIRPLPSDNAQSWLVFGDPAGGGGPSIAPVSGGFRFYTGGSTLDPAILSLNRFQAYGSSWGANAKAVLDGDLRLASTQSVYFFPTADPFGSPDVQLIRSGVGILSVINPASGLEATVLATHNTANGYKFNGTKVVGVQGAAVADATDAASVILRLNDLLARLRTSTGHGLIAG